MVEERRSTEEVVDVETPLEVPFVEQVVRPFTELMEVSVEGAKVLVTPVVTEEGDRVKIVGVGGDVVNSGQKVMFGVFVAKERVDELLERLAAF